MRLKRIKAGLADSIVRMIALLIILIAFYITAGRQLIPLIGNYDSELETFLSSQFGTDLKIGKLQGEWEGFGPKLIVHNVTVGDIFQVGHIEIQPSILSSFIEGRFVASNIEFSDIKITLKQKENEQTWDFSSFTVKPSQSNPNEIDESKDQEIAQIFDLLQPLLVQDKLTIENFSIVLEFNDAKNLGVHIEYADLNSYQDFKKITLQGWILSDEKYSNLSMVAELDEWQTNHEGRIYLSQSEFDWSQWTKYLPIPVELSKFSSELELWLTLEKGKLSKIRSRLDVPEFELSKDARTLQLQNIHTEFSMDIEEVGYQAWLNDLEFEFQGKQWENSVHQIYWSDQGVDVLSDRLDIGLISQLAVVVTDNPALKALSPSGLLLDSRLVWEKNKPVSEQVVVQGRFEDMQVSPWQGIPGLSGMQGHLDMTTSQGYVRLQPSNSWLNLPTVFEEPIYLENTQGELIWHSSPELGLELKSHQLTAEIDGVENLEMAVSVLASPKPDWDIREPRLEFQLSFDQANEKRLASFLPLTMDRQSRQWILDSVGYGTFSNACLTLSIPTIPKPDIAMSMLLNMDISDASMSFMTDWPDITQINGNLKVDSSSLNVTIPSAKFRNLNFENGTINLPFQAGASVGLTFDAAGTANDAIEILTTTPLRYIVDSNLDQWAIPRGEVAGQFKLQVPLNDQPVKGTAQLDIKDTDLVMPEYELALESVDGTLHWTDRTGISGRHLKARLFNHETDFNIRTTGEELDVIEVNAWGGLEVPDLGIWLDDAMLQSLDGSIDYAAKLKIHADYVDLDIDTDLTGLELPFSYPLEKESDEIWPVNVKLTFDNYNQTWINSTIDSRFSAAFLLQDSVIEKGQISTGLNAELPGESGVYFKLDLDRIDADDWQEHIEDIVELYESYVPAVVTGNPTFDEQIKEMTLTASEMIYFDEPWNRAEVLGARTQEGWIASFTAKEVQGTFGWGHEEDAPMIVDIDFVKVTSDEVPEGEEEVFVDLLEDYDPVEIPAAIIQVKRFILDERDLGGWTTQLKPVPDGVLISNIEGLVTGINVTGEMEWINRNGEQSTKLFSQAKLSNLGDVLAKWDLTRDVMTETGTLNLDLNWKGSPLGFELPRLEGIVDLDFRNGAILNVDQDYDSLKLLSIFNFSLIMRRLAFDFRDIVQDGIGFDSITGKIKFDDGMLVLAKPIVVDGTSTKLKLGGQYDLNSDALDFEMVFTIPLSGTLPFAALIAGLSPQVAVAVFVTERLMNNELEKFSSAKYEIKGTSEKPTYRLLKAFDNSLK